MVVILIYIFVLNYKKLVRMKNYSGGMFLFLIFIIGSVNGYPQANFEKGYYIDNADKRVDCFIKDLDWMNNPNSFEYKVLESGELRVADISHIQEFGINNVSKYYRKTVEIDKSESRGTKDLDYNKEPSFEKKQLFLKLIIEGDANLYSYEDSKQIKYFYNVADKEVTQLVYKRYMINSLKIGENNQYKAQLFRDLKCPSISNSMLRKIKYNKQGLTKVFTKYNNECSESKLVDYSDKKKRDFINLNIRPRINYSSLNIKMHDRFQGDFGRSINYGLGIELEYIFPFNNNKWSFFAEPTYQKFKSTKKTGSDTYLNKEFIMEANYSSIEIPLGIRHYLFINNNSKLFFDVSYVFDVTLGKPLIKFIDKKKGYPFNTFSIRSFASLAMGAGYKLNDKYNLQLRYISEREILDDYIYSSASYGTFSLIFGYTLF